METQATQQVRERVIQLAQEIEQLSASPLPRLQFFEAFLERLVTAVGAKAGAAWVSDQGRLHMVGQAGLPDTGFLENPRTQQLNNRLLADVIANGQARTVSPADPANLDLPDRYTLVLAALHVGKDCVGVVEIFQRSDISEQSRPGYLQFVEQMCGYASRYLTRQQQQQNRPAEDATPQSTEFMRVVLNLQRSLKVSEVAATAANEGRLLLKCDRVSIALKRGTKTAIETVSAQESVNHRSNLIRRMVKLVSKVMAAGESLKYIGKVENLPPQIEVPLADYLQESGSRMVLVIPLVEPEPLVFGDEKTDGRPRPQRPRKPFGALIVEQISESEPPPELVQRLDPYTDHVAAALYNARSHESLFLLPVWRTLGSFREWMYGRKLMKALGVLALVAAVVAALVLIPMDFRVEGQGRLMPIIQSEVFAPWDGDVLEVFVEGGDKVAAGDRLAILQNKELEAQRLAHANELSNKRSLIGALDAQRDEALRRGSREDAIRLQGEILRTQGEMAGIQEQLKIIQERSENLVVRAPIDGVVSTFRVGQLLKHRPVRRGEIMMEVVDDSPHPRDWHLELEVPEHRMGHMLRAQQKMNTEKLPVEFMLVTNPEHTYDGRVKEISTRSVASADNERVVEVLASIEDDAPLPTVGAEVRAKINCGKRAMGFVFFGDVVEFIQKYFWL